MSLKSIIVGYIVGFVFTWLMWVILPFVLGCSDRLYILTQKDTLTMILQQSLIVGFAFAILWGFMSWLSRRNSRKEDLDNAMIDYLREQMRRQNEGEI